MSAVLDRSELEQSPLADLHLLANELGVDGFRRLRKPELIDAIVARQSGEEPAPPARCHSCGSRELTTASKIINADTYWRCCACGEVWNVERLKAGARYASNPFRR